MSSSLYPIPPLQSGLFDGESRHLLMQILDELRAIRAALTTSPQDTAALAQVSRQTQDVLNEASSLVSYTPPPYPIERLTMSTPSDAIQTFAASEAATLTAIASALTATAAGITVLDNMITTLQNSPGTLSAADQASLDAIQAQSGALVSQINAISTTPPGQPVPVVASLRKK